MTSMSPTMPAQLAGDALDQLFLECAELESMVASIKQSIDRLEPAAETGLVTTEHLMNLAYRIEAAEHGLIAISHRIGDTAATMIRRRQATAPVH